MSTRQFWSCVIYCMIGVSTLLLSEGSGATVQTTQGGTPSLTIPTGVAGGPAGFAFSADGRFFVVTVMGGIRGEMVLWDAESITELRRWETEKVQGKIGFSRDSRWFLTMPNVGPDSNRPSARGVTMWDPNQQQPVQIWKKASNFALHPDGRLLLEYADGPGGAVAVDLSTGLESPFDGGRGWFGKVSADGRRALRDGDVFNLTTGERIRHFESTTVKYHWSLGLEGTDALSPDGRIVATTTDSSTRDADDRKVYGHHIDLWDSETGAHHLKIITGLAEITDLIFSADGKTLIAGNRCCLDLTQAILWDVATGRELRRVGDGAMYVALSPDGRRLATGNWYSSQLNLWELETGAEISSFQRLTADARLLGDASDGSLAVYSDGVAILRWDLGVGAAPQLWNVDDCDGRFVTPSQDSSWNRICGRAWNLETTQSVLSKYRERMRGQLRGQYFEDANAYVMYENDTTNLYRLNVETGERSSELHIGEGLKTWASSQTGRVALFFAESNGAPKQIALFNTETGEIIRNFRNPVKPEMPGGRYTHEVAFFGFSPSGRLGVRGHGNNVWYLWDGQTGEDLMVFHASCGMGYMNNNCNISWSQDESRMVVAGHLVDLVNHRTVDLELVGGNGKIKVECLSSGGDLVVGLASVHGNSLGHRRVWDAKTGRIQPGPDMAQTGRCVNLTDDGSRMWVHSRRGTIQLWNLQTGELELNLVIFPNGDWAIVDGEGRYDASRGGDIEGMYWVAGTETIALDQLKERYYEPGLLSKKLGFNDEPLRDVTNLKSIDLHPEVQSQLADGVLTIKLINRGGGIGRVPVWLNGKQVTEDARSPGQETDIPSLTLEMDLSDHPYLVPGTDNTVDVRAFNGAEYLVSRGVRKIIRAQAGTAEPPTLHAIIVGVSDYAGDMIDLRFSAKDAEDMANAFEIGAENLFGAEHTRIHLLTTNAVDSKQIPTKSNIQAAFESVAAEANSTDIVVVYLAGHGVNYGGVEGDYFYLSSEARSGELDDIGVRQARAISSAELTSWIGSIAATKQVLILDTCGAGRVVEQLSKGRDITSSQRRAFERMKDRMGLFVLAGSAADAVSYEASRYGQGLLTYSLLQGIRGAALREERFVDVASLFSHAVDMVPQLAQDIGGIQRPLLATPGGQSFDIGEMASSDWAQIRLDEPKPFILRTSFQDEDRFDDHLTLGKLVNERLRDISARGARANLVFVDAGAAGEAYQTVGRYRISASLISVQLRVLRDGELIGKHLVEGDVVNPEEVADQIVQWLDLVLAGER